MKKYLHAFLGTAAFGLVAAPVAASDLYKSGSPDLYAGVNYTFVNLEDDFIDADLGTLSGKVGVNVTPFLGVEARAGFGVDDDTISGVELSADSFFGAYATLNMVNESPMTPYVILGFTRFEIEASAGGITVSDDDSDVSYGIGMNWEVAPQVAGNVEYMRYYDKDGATVDGLGLGVTFSF